MGVYNEIAETIQQIAQQNSEQRTNWKVGKVLCVGDSLESCDVQIDADQYSDVRLNSVIDGHCDFHIVPAVGSFVMVADLSNGSMTDLAVVMYSKVERIEIGTAEHTMANADVLKEQLEVLTKRVDTIYNAITNAKPATDYSGAGLQSTMVAILNTQTQKEDWNNIENEKIKHG